MTPRALLLAARERSGLTQAALCTRLAEATGRSAQAWQAVVARYEAPAGPEPRWQTMEPVLAVLGLELTTRKRKP